MPVIGGIVQIDNHLRENRKKYLDRCKVIAELKAEAKLTSPDSLEKLKLQGKLGVEERLAALLDEVLIEIGELAGYQIYETKPGANIRCVIGRIHNKYCAVFANDPSVKGGCYYPLTVKKHLRLQEIAENLSLPCLYLVDSGGAFLPLQDEVFPDKYHFGRIFFNESRMSAKGIPQLALTLGSATAGGAYIPALADYSIMVKGTSHIFLGGPPLVKAATGLDIDSESLGGSKIHTEKSGVADLEVNSEIEGIQALRAWIKNSVNQKSYFDTKKENPKAPKFDPHEIPFFLDEQSFYTYEILGRIIDDSYLDEFKPRYGDTLICGIASINGIKVGILANNGILFSESALKATHFIQYCNKQFIPLIFFQNIVGFMVGPEYESGGIAKDGAKMVSAVSNSIVPKITVIIGASYGAGNYGMCGRAFDPLFLFAWPNSRIGVMGGKQAGKVLSIVSSKNQNPEELQNRIEREYEIKTSSLYATARLWDDGIIFVEDTRKILTNCLELIQFYKFKSFTPSYRF